MEEAPTSPREDLTCTLPSRFRSSLFGPADRRVEPRRRDPRRRSQGRRADLTRPWRACWRPWRAPCAAIGWYSVGWYRANTNRIPGAVGRLQFRTWRASPPPELASNSVQPPADLPEYKILIVVMADKALAAVMNDEQSKYSSLTLANVFRKICRSEALYIHRQ